jgi:hypothetical protein
MRITLYLLGVAVGTVTAVAVARDAAALVIAEFARIMPYL